MTRAEQLQLIDRAYSALPDLQRGITSEKVRLYNLCLDGEKRFRFGCPSRRPGLSMPQAARLFTVQAIADSLMKPQQYKIVHLLSVRPEFVYAQAVVELFEDEIREAWAGISLAKIEDLDYAGLMK